MFDRVQARTISAAGVLGATKTLAGAFGRGADTRQIASDADGGAIAVWQGFDGSDSRVEARTISAAGVLGATKTLSAAAPYAAPQISSDADGDAVAVWQGFDGSDSRVQARPISGAGVLGPTETLSGAGQDAYGPQTASDANGDAVAVWSRSDGSNNRIQASQGP